MSIQVAVRLPEEIVERMDRLVASGAARSRAAIIARALDHEMRRQDAERDARIYATSRPEFDGLANWASAQPIDLD
ncbi:MAG: hypothetical protein Q8P61_09395 [Candidatus Nanopelagicales bacterium]|nr:hypothetical protein [Candidatus Nanopelagicales bacterium]